MNFVLGAITLAAAASIAVYAMWLLASRLRKGEHKTQSFREWLKHMLEAIWGL